MCGLNKPDIRFAGGNEWEFSQLTENTGIRVIRQNRINHKSHSAKTYGNGLNDLLRISLDTHMRQTNGRFHATGQL